jgi:RND family efflux transporter MFP subunit
MKTRFGIMLLPVALLAAGCGHKEAATHEEVRPVRSVVVGATNGTVGASYSGQVYARYEGKLGFQASGKIVARMVDVGAHVKRGQVLFRLDPAQQQLHIVAATADVDAAKNRVQQNRIDLQRTEQLHARNFASQAEVDQQRLALAESESQLKSALAQQSIKVNQRDYTVLTADRDGVVTAISAEAGQVVSAGQQVVTIAADGEREVLVSVPESRVDELRHGRAFHVSVWALPGKTYPASLRELAPDTDSVTRTYSARFSIRNPDKALLLGMTASVSAPDIEGTTAIRLPLTAIYYKDKDPRVWIVDPQSARVSLRDVKLGSAQNDAVLIAGGLRDGEVVVTAGVHMLHAGQRVRLAGATPAQMHPLDPTDAKAPTGEATAATSTAKGTPAAAAPKAASTSIRSKQS